MNQEESSGNIKTRSGSMQENPIVNIDSLSTDEQINMQPEGKQK